VNFMLDNAGQTLGALKVVKKGGVIVSNSTVPSGDQMMKQMPDLVKVLFVICAEFCCLGFEVPWVREIRC
jgi:hypothetical protein